VRLRATGPHQSLLVYTYTFEVGPSALRWVIGPIVEWIFNWQTRRRFARLRTFLALHSGEVERWQQDQAATGSADPRIDWQCSLQGIRPCCDLALSSQFVGAGFLREGSRSHARDRFSPLCA
jgi:hypothetical protein